MFEKFGGMSQMDRVLNEDVHRKDLKERNLTSGVDQRVLRWLGHVERIDE